LAVPPVTAKGDGDRGYIEWKPDKRTQKLRDQVLTIVQTYPEQGLPAPTPRDVYYDVVSHYGYKKDPKLMRRIYYILRKARRAELIDFDAITDDTEASAWVGGYEDPAAFYRKMQHYTNGYTRHFEDNQDIHLELFAEGKGKVQQLARVASAYHIAVRSPGGYDRIAPKRELALRAAWEWEEYDRPTTVLHMGDFDPDGEEIYNVFVEDAHAFLSAHIDDDPEDVLTFKRIAVRPEQVPLARRGTFDLSAKHRDDTRAARWPHEYEVQLEALGVPRILEIAREEIEAVLDLDQIEADKEQSRPEREKIQANMRRLAEEAEDEEAEDEE